MNSDEGLRAVDYLFAIISLPSAIRLLNAIHKTQPTSPVVGVCLEGDTLLRLQKTVELYQEGKIDRVIVSGGVDNPELDELKASAMKQYLLGKGLPNDIIELEEKSEFTWQHPIFVNPIISERGYAKIIIITSGYHLLRAYLTFLKLVIEQNNTYNLYGFPAGSIWTWFQKCKSKAGERYRFQNFIIELVKISRDKKHLASFGQARQYLRTLNFEK